MEGDFSAPDVKPAFSWFVIDDRGSLWVEPARPAGDARRVLLVFDETGVLQGRVEIEEDVVLTSVFPVFRDDRLYAVVDDELGVPHVARYRIVKP